MSASPTIQSFLERVMQIKVMRMGGASSGILGAAGGDDEVINGLQKHAVYFAREYSLEHPDRALLTELAQFIEGSIHTLQITDTLSVHEGDKLIRDLFDLVDSIPA